MARRSNASKHPALTASGLDGSSEDTVGMGEMSLRDEWQVLTRDQKSFLSRYAMVRDGLKAAQEVGLSAAWLHDNLSNPKFQDLSNEIMARPVDWARLLLAELSPTSVEVLEELMAQPENKDVRLRAAKVVLDAVGVTTENVQRTPSVKLEVKMYPMSPTPVVEAPRMEVVDDDTSS
jgi:hypothetical protein